MRPKDEKPESKVDVARLISRQLRRAENARFLGRLPGFEVRRELPSQIANLLMTLQEVESSRTPPGMQQSSQHR